MSDIPRHLLPILSRTRLAHWLIIVWSMAGLCLPLRSAALQAVPSSRRATDDTVFQTTRCAPSAYRGLPALFQALRTSDYVCTEELSLALRPYADDAIVSQLLALIDSDEHDLTRRNAVRVLGRLAESGYGTHASELVRRTRAAEIQTTLGERLHADRDVLVLQDVVWLFDSVYFPALAVQPDLERISGDVTLEPVLRARTAAAAGRLIGQKTGLVAPTDLAFTLAALRSDEAGVRAQAALILARLRSTQFSPALRQQIIAALGTAWQREPPLAVQVDPPDQATVTMLAATESTATSLTVRANLARALDRYDGGQRLQQVQAAYEILALPQTQALDGIVIRADLDDDELAMVTAALQQTRTAFFKLVGPAAATPLPNDTTTTPTVLVFGSQAAYRDYMRAFTPFTVDVDGIYAEADATLYTYRRLPGQTENTLATTVRHEFTHYLTGRYLFPGMWSDRGYHREPRGWADEGLAEVLAAQGHLDQHHLADICAHTQHRDLAGLLRQRAGYDQFGRFDYAYAWAFSYYLLTEHSDAAQRIYAAYRDGHYQQQEWAQIAGVDSIDTLDAEWHAVMNQWCYSDE